MAANVDVFYAFQPTLPGGNIQVTGATSDSDARAQALAIVTARKATADAQKAQLDDANAFFTS